MFEFREIFNAKLINFRPDEFVDRKTGEVTRFFRVDLVGEIDGQPRALNLTCGGGALSAEPGQYKTGAAVECQVIPAARNGRIAPRLVSLVLV